MEYINTYLIFPFERDEEAQIRTWLDNAHYPNAIDKERSRIIVFNISERVMPVFVNQFRIRDWSFVQSAIQPDEYTELFRHFDFVISENSEAFRSRTSHSGYHPLSIYSNRYRTLAGGFSRDGYTACRHRFYLSRNLLGLSVKELQPCPFSASSGRH